MAREYPFIQMEGGRWRNGADKVVEETTLSLILNGRNILAAMLSPEDIDAFVVGFLYTEEIVRGIDEIESIKRDDNVVSVLTRNPFKVGGTKIILSGCGGTTSHLDTRRLPKISSSLTVPSQRITEAMEQLLASVPEPQIGGAHAVALAGREGTAHVVSDIGLHTALDKAIGHALRAGTDLAQRFALSSERISSEMVRKCLVANIPLIAARGTPTSLAIDLAEKAGLCVIGFVQGGKMKIFTHPEHVEGTPAVS